MTRSSWPLQFLPPPGETVEVEMTQRETTELDLRHLWDELERGPRLHDLECC